ncbi:complex I NDUFA9 subunit family protein [Chachezhania antarctica]|uniref:complex I NDUFA9 subunit family protein n=1 Tax=Chachezhania antarctica TaxID=2340860 RepID=UPI000EB58D1F|nr:complex I NDUFA9 subunit family protein [Chachezhania antarctica]
MSKLVTIYGGSGFVGRYIARRMAQAGWRVRVACRHPNEAIFVRPYGVVGQVEPVFCNIRDDASVASVLHGADAVVSCVGILSESGKQTFDAVQVDGAARIARLTAEAGIGHLVHVSAIGADADGPSEYARTKAEGEAAVLEHMPGAVILRPSIIFGAEDNFMNRFAAMATMTPVLPVVAADTKFQPVWVDDVAAAAVKAIRGDVPTGVYELGGPEVISMYDLMGKIVAMIRRTRPRMKVPFFVARVMAWSLDMLQAGTFGLVSNGTLTRDQLKSLTRDNVVADDARTFADLGIEPTAMDAVLPDYLWVYRPGGQYSDAQESASRMRIDRA